MQRTHDNSPIKLPPIFWFSLIIGSCLILVNLFSWSLVDLLTVFIQPILEFLVWCLFFSAFLGSFIYIFFNLKRHKAKALLPFLINIITFLLVVYVPFTDIWLYLDFQTNFAERKQVISLVESGELKPNVSYTDTLIALPEEYKNTSKGGGDILLEKKGDKKMILFFTFRGISDNFSGFVYSPDNQKPSSGDFSGDFKQIKKIKDRWFWVASS
jgi:hypothetical protein